ncbi:hypothetical protein [Paenibacillus taichungensis]|uniref:hypothetical protein n=1 Tax=Paenibacillus taichungensis TaxID=484184 RepID=UPI0035DE06F1
MFEARSEGTGIDSEEAKRSPLSPNFNLIKGYSKKFGDNSDQKNDPGPERVNNKVFYTNHPQRRRDHHENGRHYC